MAYLGNAPARSFISFERQVFTIVNSQTAYALSHSVANENDIRLVVNNVVQEPGSGKAYTATGTALTLSAALTNGTDEMYCVFLGRATATSAPGAGSIGTAQLAADAVTNAKVASTVITGQTAETSIATDDLILLSDTSASGALKKMTRANFVSGVGGTNTPNFLATMSSSQNPSSATATLVNFNQTTYDSASGFDTSNKKYVIPSAGYYHIYANVNMYNTSNDLDRIIGYIYIGGGLRFQTDIQIPNAPSAYVYLGGVYNCSANDAVEIKIYQVMGSGTTTIPTDKNYFGGYKIIT